jgi:hypothetical protein
MMKGFRNSWWVHWPGVIAITLMVAVMAARRPWPGRAPVHFNFRFESNRWGSPSQAAIFPFLAASDLIAGILLSAIWSGHEEGRKRFNLVLPVVTLPLGAVAGLHLWYWWNLPTLAEKGNAPLPWVWLGIAAAVVAAGSLLLERRRRPMPARGPEVNAAR